MSDGEQKRLDRPDREKIAKKLREIYRYDLDWYPTWAKLSKISKERWLKKADGILDYIEPPDRRSQEAGEGEDRRFV